MAFDHRDGASGPNPYAPQMGRTFAPLDLSGPLTVLDPARATTLTAWVARLIPGNADWPSAADLDTVNYIDEIVRQAPTLRPVLIGGIDAVDSTARSRDGRPFVDLDADRQTAILRDIEATGAPAAFSMVLELCYEAYYRAPRVQRIVAQRTGFEVRNTVDGKPMKPFPVERLATVRTRPDHFRSVNA
ncbi:gluconate 2-dehydrogenase subunit 3-like protein [Labedella gwakjiensis]|uniref:Gluconate 2-dehydrogenase subunit 3 family protein n=1 Tax=Labedella gwakjiensis TaxID=390269 RepID=A0A2P8GUA4_9MICO|nr:gluconate 2-dehydrogenase subunit 3 family protein [Labedella gwakjiensis]PSL37535.1 gluconate 2-dehydrogenase subunit 3-like protein [Labedella gwakjiensis]RUQ84835.1 gluconate 2-dehydrogenase subunit 3 family protein [Labedella gwakjiensis]